MKKWLYVLCVGYIFVFYSEFTFWGRVPADQNINNFIFLWLAYSLGGFAFLQILVRFRVTERHGMFLAGAVFGWFLEGIIVQTTYEILPLSISFTALAWHALITVMVGYYGLSQALLTGRHLLRWVVGIGLFWGFWAVFWHTEDPAAALPTEQFALHAFIITLPLMLAYVGLHQLPFDTRPREFFIVPGVFALLFAVVAFFMPIAVLVLPPLLYITYRALRKNQQRNVGQASLLVALQGYPPLPRYLWLLLMPVVATMIHALLLAVGFLETGYIVYIVLTPAGFWLFLRAIWLNLRQNAHNL